VRIFLLVAGTNNPSNAEVLADHFVEGMRQEGELELTKLCLRDLKIDHFDLHYYVPKCETEDDFCRLQELVERADGMVIASPVWNFSVPAHLKNVIDRIGAFALDRETRARGMLPGTPMYFLFTGGAPVAVWKGLMRFTTSHVREAFRYYGASVLGVHFEGKCMPGRGTFGVVVDQRPESLRRAQKKGRKFAKHVRRFAESKKLSLYHVLFHVVYKWGQRVAAKL
jgi:multimeric flavodoxin WrbA